MKHENSTMQPKDMVDNKWFNDRIYGTCKKN